MQRTNIWAVALIMLVVLLGTALSAPLVGAAPAEATFWTREQGQEYGEEQNAFCVDPELIHPVAAKLVARYEGIYDVTYDQVMVWFCDDGMGFGQIMLALRTAALTDDDPGTLLERRAAGEGWGEIWQDLGLIGRARTARNWAPGNGPPPWAGPPEERDPDAEKPGNGPPAWAGPPEERDPDAEKPGNGPPPWAGPPEERDPDAEKPGNGPPPWAGPPEERDPDAEKPGNGPPPWAGPPEERDPDAGNPGRGPKKP